MTVLAVAVSDAWFLWVMLLLFFGRGLRHAAGHADAARFAPPTGSRWRR
jgi:hypothetical protein